LSGLTAMKSDRLEIRVRPGLREKAAAIQSRYLGYGQTLTDLIHILIDREHERLQTPRRPALNRIAYHARAIQSILDDEAARQQDTEDAAEINEILRAARAAESRTE
jgi:hypothetical protein